MCSVGRASSPYYDIIDGILSLQGGISMSRMTRSPIRWGHSFFFLSWRLHIVKFYSRIIVPQPLPTKFWHQSLAVMSDMAVARPDT